VSETTFNSLALQIFAHQLRHNAPYARFCASLGVGPDAMPARWEDIPAVPVSAFKDATLTTFEPGTAELQFETSGTTQRRAGVHFMENAALYRASLLAAFDRAMLPDCARLRYLNVVPSSNEKPRSSLAYMLDVITSARGDGLGGWYVHGDQLAVDEFVHDTHAAISDGIGVCITGTAFGLLNLLDALSARNESFELPPRSRMMETGGFKGRTREIERRQFYRLLSERFGIEEPAITAEYGMTELSSQCYDSLESRSSAQRIKVSPPWLRSRVVDPVGKTIQGEQSGALVHVDLANRSSVLAIATDDLASAARDGFLLHGRLESAGLRGCSLDAEDLWSSVR